MQATPAGSWGNQSPCTEWKARDVVAHVANNLRKVTGGALPDVTADEDITAAWAATRDAVHGALASADLSANVDTPLGAMPLEAFIGRIISTDVLVHTWDLARAVGGDDKLDAEAVTGAYSGLKPMDAMIRRPGLFDARIDVPAGSDVQTEFLSFLGRTV